MWTGADVMETSGIIWLAHSASQFKLNTPTSFHSCLNSSKQAVILNAQLVTVNSELEVSVFLSFTSGFFLCLSPCLSVSSSLCLFITFYVLLSLTSPPSHLNFLMKNEHTSQGLWSVVTSIWATEKETANRFLLVLLITFLTFGELHFILLSLLHQSVCYRLSCYFLRETGVLVYQMSA